MTAPDIGKAAGWDFFLSYHQSDRAWAEWIAWQLEASHYRVLVQAWDFVPGTNWVHQMQAGLQDSARLIVVLSPVYLEHSTFGAAEWQSTWASDPTGAGRRVLPLRIAHCERPGLLAGIVGVDLFGVPETTALERLLTAARDASAGRAKPATTPTFPGSPGGTAPSPNSSTPPAFPADATARQSHYAQGVQIGSGNTQINNFGRGD